MRVSYRYTFKKLIVVLLLGAILALGISPLTVEAATIHVPTGEPTIQGAINAAVNGDTVLVAPGTFIENINFLGKAIRVQSEQGPEVTIIDGNRTGSVVTFETGEGTESVLNGFTLQNGLAGFNGGGAKIVSASPVITGNIITGNAACTGGGGIGNSNGGSPVIKGNIITGNMVFCSGGAGGGIEILFTSGTAQILENTISHNSGGGISLNLAGTPTIRGNIISENTVGSFLKSTTQLFGQLYFIWIGNQ